MKYIRIISFFFYIFLSKSLFSQERITLNWDIPYNDPSMSIYFDNAVFMHGDLGLPSFQQIFKTTYEEFYDIELADIQFINVLDSELEQLKRLEINQDVKFSSELLMSANDLFQRILVFPYIKRGDTYQKISSFRYARKDIVLSEKTKKISFKTNSVLRDGDWYKMSVNETGVYALSFADLQSLGVNMNGLSVNSIRIYGNGGGMLPRHNLIDRDDDLIENSIDIIDQNNNNLFEDGDMVLFYAESADQWILDQHNVGRYHHQKHLYDDNNYYFLTIRGDLPVSRITFYNATLSDLGSSSSIVNICDYHEKDEINFIQSGENWYGEVFDAVLNQSFVFNIPNIVNDSNIYISSGVASRSFSPSSFSFNSNGNSIMNIPLNSVTSGFATDYATVASSSSQFISNSDVIDIDVIFNRNSSSHKGWLDYIEICGYRHLVMNGSQMNIRKTMNVLEDQIYSLIIEDISSNHRVWNVTDPTNVKEHSIYLESGNKYSFEYDVFEGLSEEKFIAFDGTNYLSPTFKGMISNQDLHGETDFEMLIVCHPDFTSAANTLSSFHFEQDGRKCKVVSPQEIYNEFSSGKQDISAIRDYCKYLYNLPNTDFKYLLIIGDASYDPKERIPNNTNYVITYQSLNSVSPLNTFATDDYFGYLDPSEGLLENDLLDIGIGRLPAKTLSEANSMVNKIIHYSRYESMGSWRNMVCFVADDGDDNDGNIHMSQAESLSNIVDDNHQVYNFQKIYLDAYNQESTPAGQRSPQAKDAINRRVQDGTLIMNYTGHGGEGGITSERILDVDQILNWENYNNLPLFITATCEFGRFDNPDLTSAGEHIILNPQGGGVALLTTTRYVYSHLNYNLNTNFINSLFEKVNGEYQTLGEIFLQTKALSGTSINSNKFTLLGDPMMYLSYPDYDVLTTIFPDTISALEKVNFQGEIIDKDSLKVSGFNGTIYTTIFDKETMAVTQGQESCTPMPYRKQTNIIYKGKSSVKNGEFSFSFVVPKDIDYTVDVGRLSYYALEDSDNIDASGSNEDFLVGGTSSDIIEDDIGPNIQLYMNDKQFVSGGLTNTSPIFLAFIQDSSGINTVGNGIGHDITITLDGASSDKIILNDYYEADIDSYQSGRVEYQLDNLSQGIHTIDFKVWDVFNNSSESSIDFLVSESEDIVIKHLLNYPNPFTSNTDFYFEHNRPNQLLDIQIQIFTVSGKLVKTINTLENNNSFRVGPISWNGKDDFQDNIGRGTYIYKLKVKDEYGEYVEKLEKLVILR